MAQQSNSTTSEFVASLARVPGTVMPKVELVVTGVRLYTDMNANRKRLVLSFSSPHGEVSCWALPGRGETAQQAARRTLSFLGMDPAQGSSWVGTKLTRDVTVTRHCTLCVFTPTPEAPSDVAKLVAQF